MLKALGGKILPGVKNPHQSNLTVFFILTEIYKDETTHHYVLSSWLYYV